MRGFIVLLVSLFCISGFAQSINNTPVGYWKTVDDVTGRVQSIVEIYQTTDHHLAGKIIKTFPKPGDVPLKICSACRDDRHDKPIIGLVIMNDLVLSEGNEWKQGKILDPRAGKIYKCSMALAEDNQKLTVRGYIGIPLFGRTQTWLRTLTV